MSSYSEHIIANKRTVGNEIYANQMKVIMIFTKNTNKLNKVYLYHSVGVVKQKSVMCMCMLFSFNYYSSNLPPKNVLWGY